MVEGTEPYTDIRDLAEESLELLAQRRARYSRDDLAAMSLLTDPGTELKLPWSGA